MIFFFHSLIMLKPAERSVSWGVHDLGVLPAALILFSFSHQPQCPYAG